MLSVRSQTKDSGCPAGSEVVTSASSTSSDASYDVRNQAPSGRMQSSQSFLKMIFSITVTLALASIHAVALPPPAIRGVSYDQGDFASFCASLNGDAGSSPSDPLFSEVAQLCANAGVNAGVGVYKRQAATTTTTTTIAATTTTEATTTIAAATTTETTTATATTTGTDTTTVTTTVTGTGTTSVGTTTVTTTTTGTTTATGTTTVTTSVPVTSGTTSATTTASGTTSASVPAITIGSTTITLGTPTLSLTTTSTPTSSATATPSATSRPSRNSLAAAIRRFLQAIFRNIFSGFNFNF